MNSHVKKYLRLIYISTVSLGPAPKRGLELIVGSEGFEPKWGQVCQS